MTCPNATRPDRRSAEQGIHTSLPSRTWKAGNTRQPIALPSVHMRKWYTNSLHANYLHLQVTDKNVEP